MRTESEVRLAVMWRREDRLSNPSSLRVVSIARVNVLIKLQASSKAVLNGTPTARDAPNLRTLWAYQPIIFGVSHKMFVVRGRVGC